MDYKNRSTLKVEKKNIGGWGKEEYDRLIRD